MKERIININYDKKIILEDLFEIYKNLQFFKKNNIPIYFPFNGKILKDEKKMINQILKDEKNNIPQNIIIEINEFLEKYEK